MFSLFMMLKRSTFGDFWAPRMTILFGQKGGHVLKMRTYGKPIVTAPTLETNSDFSLSLCLSHVFLSAHLISSSAAL